jgi:hypothetical protein
VPPLAAFDPQPEPFIAVMALGFLVGVLGHVYKRPWWVGTGIALVFMATLGLPLLLYATQ